MPVAIGYSTAPALEAVSPGLHHSDFTHVTERQTETIDGQTAFVISPALKNVFIPQRERIMEDYLNDKLKKAEEAEGHPQRS